MKIENLPTYQLTRLGAKICRHCDHFRKPECAKAPPAGTREFKKFNWSSLSTCDNWKPNPRTDEALQVLTFRRLEGEDITDFLENVVDEDD